LVGLNEALGTTIMMVTHDSYAASYCKRVIFLRDGAIVNEIYAGAQVQKTFYDRILETQSLMGGKPR
jgi:putative ABC transport system ATP-binding protein